MQQHEEQAAVGAASSPEPQRVCNGNERSREERDRDDRRVHVAARTQRRPHRYQERLPSDQHRSDEGHAQQHRIT